MTINRFISKLLVFFPDSIYLKIKYFYCFKKQLSLKNVNTYNEKLQWLKLNDRNSLYSSLVDKQKVKKHVSDILGYQYIIPTICTWSNADEIDISKLPDKFVLKCNHDSHSTFICKDKSKFDIDLVKNLLSKSLKSNYYIFSREYPYNNVIPLIIAEEYIEDTGSEELIDYKFFCFNGEPKFVGICTNRIHGLTWDLFDLNFNHIDVKYVAKNNTNTISKPRNFDKMIEIARKLSSNIPHVRIDLYEVNNQIYFGEYTFYSSGGFAPFTPNSYDYLFGSYITKI